MPEFDVVVIGGGTAGAPAAIAAARMGMKTLVIEQQNSLGGTQTQGWVTPMMPNYLGDFKLNRGLNLEINERLARRNVPGDGVVHGDVWYDPLTLAVVLDEMAAEARVRCFFGASLLSAETDNNRIRSAKVLCRNELIEITASQWIDATGDAVLSSAAGAEVVSGDEDGWNQPMTLRFFMGNINLAVLTERLDIWRTKASGFYEAGFGEATDSNLAPMIADAISKGILQEGDLGYFQVFSVVGRPNELAFNCPRIAGLDPMDPVQFSLALQVGRAKIDRIARFVKAYFPGCQQAFVSGVAPMMGIRESRRVIGEYYLTGEDHARARKFPDPVARNRYPIDIHREKGITHERYPEYEFHDIPYGCVVAKGLQNLWVAGRCCSADFVAQSAIRIQPVCRALGEAAGVAAALCREKNLSAKDLPYVLLEPHLDLSLPG